MTDHYLDHNATTPADPRVLERFLEVEQACPANPASVHGLGRRALSIVEEAREQTAAALSCSASDIVFVSGGTEANNLAIRGLGNPDLPVLMAPVEHPSVVEPAKLRGIVHWRVDGQGRAQVEPPASKVGLIALVHGQSEVGTLQPVVVAAELSNDLQVPLHVDAAQTLGRVALDDVMQLAASVSLSPHKAGGLRGSGVLVARAAGHRLRPLLRGGEQEHGLRPGTVSPAHAASTALAIELAQRERTERASRMRAGVQALLEPLVELMDAAHVRNLTPVQDALPNTVMLAIRGVEGRTLLPALDLDGLAVSQGSACATGSPQPPRVLTAMGLEDDEARACIRLSLGRDSDRESCAAAGLRLARVIVRLRKKK